MAQLEKVYLLNVLLYLDDIETIETFISVNKKCQEVTEMIHYFDFVYDIFKFEYFFK